MIEKIEKIERGGNQGIKELDQRLLMETVELGESVGVTYLPVVKEAKRLLALSEDTFLKMKLHAAIKTQDTEKIIAQTFALKSHFFRKSPTLAWTMDRYLRLRPPSEYEMLHSEDEYDMMILSEESGGASRNIKKITSMLEWQPYPIRTSLTLLPISLVSLATRIFKDIMVSKDFRVHR